LCNKKIFYELTGMNAEDIIDKTINKIDENILDKLF
jgi:hypothetical protein